jgi:hypothetical protein
MWAGFQTGCPVIFITELFLHVYSVMFILASHEGAVEFNNPRRAWSAWEVNEFQAPESEETKFTITEIDSKPGVWGNFIASPLMYITLHERSKVYPLLRLSVPTIQFSFKTRSQN